MPNTHSNQPGTPRVDTAFVSFGQAFDLHRLLLLPHHNLRDVPLQRVHNDVHRCPSCLTDHETCYMAILVGRSCSCCGLGAGPRVLSVGSFKIQVV